MKRPKVEKLSPIIQEPIRTYIKIFPSGGVDPVPESEYEILDGNTFLDKRNPKKLKMYPFTYIFNNEFDNKKIINHMKIVDDGFQGKDQLVIVSIEKQNFKQFLIGNNDEYGFIIEAFQSFYRQKHLLELEGEDNKINISFSMFSTSSHYNKFTDLILGQRLTYYSKKDMDEHKNFYQKEITSIQQFLICLKIGMVHYNQCCQQTDPIVCRLTINYNEHNSLIVSCFHLVVGINGTKIVQMIQKKVQQSLQTTQISGQDHGSLANYVQKILKKGKLIYLYGMPYRRENMKKSVSIFQFLQNLKGHSFHILNNISQNPQQSLNYLKQFQYERYKPDLHSLSHKQVLMINKNIQRIIQFFVQAQQKWKSYCILMEDIRKIQTQFYDKQRFPVSLEIKDENVKSFIISKIYKLSQKYQMEDLCGSLQKIRILKNQIYIGLKTLVKIKENKDCIGKGWIQFTVFYNRFISNISKGLKYLFSFNFRVLECYKINILSLVNVGTFNFTVLQEGKQKLKIGKNDKEKEEILLRKIKFESTMQGDLCGNSNSFQMFKENKKGCHSLAEIKLSHRKQNLQQSQLLTNSNSSVVLPHIAVIKRKKKQ